MQPPCLKPGQPMNPCAGRLYQEKVLGHVDLAADWAGWKLRGRWLISPEGDRINPLRLRGLMFAEAGQQRIAQAKAKGGHRGAVVELRGPARGSLSLQRPRPDGQS